MADKNLSQNLITGNKNLSLRIEVGFNPALPESKQYGALVVSEYGYGTGTGKSITEAISSAIDDLVSNLPGGRS